MVSVAECEGGEKLEENNETLNNCESYMRRNCAQYIHRHPFQHVRSLEATTCPNNKQNSEHSEKLTILLGFLKEERTQNNCPQIWGDKQIQGVKSYLHRGSVVETDAQPNRGRK